MDNLEITVGFAAGSEFEIKNGTGMRGLEIELVLGRRDSISAVIKVQT